MMLNPNGLLSLDKKVQLRPYVAPIAKQYKLATDSEIVNGAGGTLIVDTESYYNYFLIAFKDIKTNKIIILEPPFNHRKLAWIMHNYRTVGFNSINYDLLMIWCSHTNQDTKLLQQLSQNIIYGGMRKKELLDKYNFIIYPTKHIDLIEVCPLKGSLKLYGARLHSPRIQDLPFDVNADIPLKQIPIVRDYCINDLDETHRLFDFLKERLDLRQSMSIEYKEDLMSKSDAQIAEIVICKEIYKASGRLPKRPEIKIDTCYKYNLPDYIKYQSKPLQELLDILKKSEFIIDIFNKINSPKELNKLKIPIGKNVYTFGIGGLHSTEKNISCKSSNTHFIIDRDVKSYYPRIILNLKLYPEHLGSVFLDIFNSLTKRRLSAQAAKRLAEDKGLKVTINGTGGKFNDKWSKLRSPNCFIHMTLTGQLSLLMLIERFELAGVQVISGNTDGIVTLVPKELEQIFNNIIDKWEKDTGFITEETRYKSYYARDVNAYFAVKEDGSVKLKGPWAEIGSATGTQLDINPNALICTDAICALLSKEISIEETILNCKDITRFICVRNVKGGAHKNGYYLGKTIRWYYSVNTVGTINYIINNNKVADTENAKPCMELPKGLPTDIAYDWYISRTNEILEEISYHKKQEQFKLFNT